MTARLVIAARVALKWMTPEDDSELAMLVLDLDLALALHLDAVYVTADRRFWRKSRRLP